jgi:TRAP transporter TAXI family solute receptor
MDAQEPTDMRIIDRRGFLAAAGALAMPWPAFAQGPELEIMTAGPGSAFLPYGQGLAKVIGVANAATIAVKESKGSNENLSGASPTTLGTAFLGSAFDAINGTGFAAGKKHANVRALFPMYETAFMAATLGAPNIGSVKQLDGKRVGCGPAGGPAEGYFRAAADIAGIKPTIIGGTPADQGKQLLAGELDAFWQGAVVPIPSLVEVTKSGDCIVFGLSDAEIVAMRGRFPYMAEVAVAAGTYRGQTAPLKSVAAWNVVICHKDLPEATAYAITKAVLTSKTLIDAVGAVGRSTSARNAGVNTIVPYHPGAERALKELA